MDAQATSPHPHAAAIRAQLERILQGETFRDAQRSSQLLRYIVEAVLQGRASTLKEYTLGADALGRGVDFDPRFDAIARVEASRLRTRLAHYYATEGTSDAWLIVLPKGTYVPEITLRDVTTNSGVAQSRAVFSRALMWTLVVAGVAIFLSAFLLWQKPLAGVGAVATASAMVRMDPGAPVEISSEVGNDLALSASGSRLVFVGRAASGGYSLFTRDMRGLEARELPGTGGARVPALSPDGDWVMYWAEGELRKTRADGTGRPISVLRTPDALGIDWIDQNNIVVGLTPFELVRIDLRNGATTSLVHPPNSRRLIFPQSLQRGELILGTSDEGQVGNAAIELLDVSTGQRTVLVRGAMFGRYVKTGHLLFVRGGTLYAARMDLAARSLVGEPQPIMEGVAWSPTFAYAQYAVADNGLLLVLRGGDGAETVAAWVEGRQAIKVPEISGLLQWPRLSPDGKRLAVMRREAADYDLWVYDLASGTGRKLADQAQDLQSPVWSADGQYIVYASRTGGIWWSRDGATGVLMQD